MCICSAITHLRAASIDLWKIHSFFTALHVAVDAVFCIEHFPWLHVLSFGWWANSTSHGCWVSRREGSKVLFRIHTQAHTHTPFIIYCKDGKWMANVEVTGIRTRTKAHTKTVEPVPRPHTHRLTCTVPAVLFSGGGCPTIPNRESNGQLWCPPQAPPPDTHKHKHVC